MHEHRWSPTTGYGRLWKPKTLRACRLHGTRRDVLSALLLLCDWKGRISRPYHEIAAFAAVSPRTCSAALADLLNRGFITLIEAGRGRRPNTLQIVPADQIAEP